MCWRELDCTTFVQKPTRFAWRGGNFHLEIELSESAVLRLVYPPDVFLASLLSAEQTMAEFQAEQIAAASNVHELYPVEKLAG